MSPWLCFVAGVVALIYLPGKLVVSELVDVIDPLERVTLSAIVGLVTGSVAYWIAGATGMKKLFLLWPLLAGVLLLRRGWLLRRGSSQGLDLGPALPRGSVWRSLGVLAAPVAVGLALFIALPQYDSNLTFRPDGAFRIGPIFDPIFHVAIASELQRRIPPRNPFFAGYPLSYHSGSDLPVAMLADFAWLDVRDLTVRLLPPLFFVLGVCSTYCFARFWLGSTLWAALTSFLVFFGEDFSFVPGLLKLKGFGEDWSAEFFPYAPTTYSLFFANPMLPALALLFAGLFTCAKYLKDGGGGWLLLAGGLFAALLECKVFTGMQVLLALAIGTCLLRSSIADSRLLHVAALTAILDAPLLFFAWLGDRAGPRIFPQLRVDFLWSGPTFFFLICGFGLRSLAIPRIVKDLLHPRLAEPLRLFVAIFVVAGVVTLFVRLVPEGMNAAAAMNNGVWFLVQSKYVAWLFVAEVLRKLTQWLARRWGSFAAASVVISTTLALSVPSTVQHFSLLMAVRDPVIGRDRVAALKFLERHSLPGDVVLVSEDLVIPLLAVTKCHVPFLPNGESYVYLLPHDEYQHRTTEEANFWRAWELGEVQINFLSTYKVKFVLADRTNQATRMNEGPLRKVFENSATVIFLVPDAVRRARGTSILDRLVSHGTFVHELVTAVSRSRLDPLNGIERQ